MKPKNGGSTPSELGNNEENAKKRPKTLLGPTKV